MGEVAELDRVEYGAEVCACQVQDISRLLIGGTETTSIITFNLCNALLRSAIVKGRDPRILLTGMMEVFANEPFRQ
jgi:hypothetical protein